MTIQGLSKNGYSVTLCCPHVGILEISQHSIPTCTKLMLSNSWASPPRKPLAIIVIFFKPFPRPAQPVEGEAGGKGDPGLGRSLPRPGRQDLHPTLGVALKGSLLRL